jgi:hypothetical protein
LGEAFDLAHAKGIEQFAGSAAARELLARHGFVVADPAFRQIFEPYIESPQTANTIAGLLHWSERLLPYATPEEREALIRRAKEWARAAAQP